MPISAYEKYTEGLVLLEEDKKEDALAAFLESLALDEHFKTCERIAELSEGLGRIADAETYIRRGYQLNPNNSKVATKYAEVLFSRGESKEATQILRDTLRKNTSYGPARRLLELNRAP